MLETVQNQNINPQKKLYIGKVIYLIAYLEEKKKIKLI